MSGLLDAKRGLTVLNIKDNSVMEKMMYLLAQYLAAAGISFLEKKDDDSHSNLGFSIENSSMYSRPLNENGDTLSVSYKKFSLEWNSNDVSTSLRLDGTTHAEILKWIEKIAAKAAIKVPYTYSFHYDFPYQIKDNFVFKLLDPKRLRELLNLRILAQSVLEAFLQDQNLNSEIRIWPHHFDTGAYAIFNDMTGDAIGLGLAVPDTVCRDHYLYISGYKGHEVIDTSGFKPLSLGSWGINGFNGAILPATEIDKNTGTAFLSEAFFQYKN
ncbi:hypothetical protein [uncultured Eudoraea sp.]|uniref:hypothetical protein n=1 Tax=uncultured Eudoraea sp. TaxID=1035614 RepID=UPI00262A4C75|nr:hypothetical protein [uncultured Eudoraea sp.]